MIYAFGAYGTGNLGDEAIFQGLMNEVSPEEVIQIYVNVPTYPKNLNYDDMLKHRNLLLKPGDTFIIGGGGLFYNKENLINMNNLANTAIRHGMKFQIRGLGCEGDARNEKALIQKLCSKASLIEVRSKESKRILEDYNIDKVILTKDFAYNLKPDTEAAKKIFPAFKSNYPTLGLSTGGNRDDIDKLSYIIRYLTFRKVNILHLPHCRHYTDRYCNDVATGEMLWSNIAVWCGERINTFKLLPYAEKPETLLGAYHLVDGVLGMRYHSFIFSEVANKPIFGLTSGSKATNYFIEHPDKPYLDIGKSKEELLGSIQGFLRRLK